MLEKYTNKELSIEIIGKLDYIIWQNWAIIVLGGFALYFVFQYLKVAHTDHGHIFKKLNRISGDLPE